MIFDTFVDCVAMTIMDLVMDLIGSRFLLVFIVESSRTFSI